MLGFRGGFTSRDAFVMAFTRFRALRRLGLAVFWNFVGVAKHVRQDAESVAG